MPYEFDAVKYEKASTHQKEWGNEIIAQLALSGNEKILDLGCGDGALSVQLAQRVPEGHVLGIDASEAMVELARKNESANLHFLLQDINAMEYAGEFDLIFSNATLHWIKDHALLLRNTHRALKPGGVARFNFAGEGNCRALIAVLREVMARSEFAAYFADFDWPWFMPSASEYRQLVEGAGFAEANVWKENADRAFPDAQTITKWIEQPSLVPFLPNVPTRQRPSFRDAVVERMLHQTIQQDGQYFETFRRINVYARK